MAWGWTLWPGYPNTVVKESLDLSLRGQLHRQQFWFHFWTQWHHECHGRHPVGEWILPKKPSIKHLASRNSRLGRRQQEGSDNLVMSILFLVQVTEKVVEECQTKWRRAFSHSPCTRGLWAFPDATDVMVCSPSWSTPGSRDILGSPPLPCWWFCMKMHGSGRRSYCIMIFSVRCSYRAVSLPGKTMVFTRLSM